MKKFRLITITGIALFISACGQTEEPKDEISLQRASIVSGEWALEAVRCNEQESTLLADQLLSVATIVSSSLIFDGQSGKRIWNVGACRAETTLSSIQYPTDNDLLIQDGVTQCGTGCEQFAVCNTPFVATPAADYHFSLSGDSLHVILPPETITASSSPCGPGQGTNPVKFIYHKKTSP